MARNLHREVVGFAAGRIEDAGIEIARQPLHQHFAELDDALVQVARMRVERRGLVAQRFDDVRMAMTDRDHVVVTVEIFPAVDVPQGSTRAAHQVQRFVEETLVGRAERFVAACNQFLVGHTGYSGSCL